MMPRIYFSQGVWWCAMPGQRNASYGHGKSPQAAYWAWAWLEERLGRRRRGR